MVIETTSSSEPKVMSKPVEDIPVEEIVYDAKLTYAQRLSEAREEIGKSLLLSELGQARRIGDINKEISHILMHNREDVHDRMEKAFRIMEYFVGSSDASSGNTKTVIASFIQDMTERYSFTVMYRDKIAQLRLKLSLQEDSIQELKERSSEKERESPITRNRAAAGYSDRKSWRKEWCFNITLLRPSCE